MRARCAKNCWRIHFISTYGTLVLFFYPSCFFAKKREATLKAPHAEITRASVITSLGRVFSIFPRANVYTQRTRVSEFTSQAIVKMEPPVRF